MKIIPYLSLLALLSVMQTENPSGLDDPGSVSLQAPPINTSPGPEYRGERRIFQGIPGIERSPGGRLWATWYGGGDTEGPDNYVMLVTSADDGRSWSDLQLVIDPEGEVRAFDPCLWVDPAGGMWLFWAQAYHFWDGRGGVWGIHTASPDQEKPEWSDPVRIAEGVMMNKPTALRSGEWLLPAAVWNIPIDGGNPEYEHAMGDLIGSNVVASTDQGNSWSLLGQAHIPDVACDEHIIVELRDGRLWMLARTTYGIGESYSEDRGETWSPGKASRLNHIPKARFCLRRLASGNLLFINHSSPDGKTRSHLTAYLSSDEGNSWKGGLTLDARKGVSYPDITEGEEGQIYCIYDFSRRDEMEILMAVFTEQDILRKEFPDGSRSRILVNKASGKRD